MFPSPTNRIYIAMLGDGMPLEPITSALAASEIQAQEIINHKLSRKGTQYAAWLQAGARVAIRSTVGPHTTPTRG